jgi:putative transposase
MKGRKTSVDQIIRTLREVEVLQGQGITIDNACKKLEVSTQTFYKWRKEYGNLSIDKAKKLKALESENARLKKLVADLSLDNAILKEAAEGNF